MGISAAKTLVEDKPELCENAVEAVFKVMDAWALSDAEQARLLGLNGAAEVHDWRYGFSGRLTFDVLRRISHLISIYQTLHLLLPDTSVAAAWLRRPNQSSFFRGQSVLARMLSGAEIDLARVKDHLEAQIRIGSNVANDQ